MTKHPYVLEHLQVQWCPSSGHGCVFLTGIWRLDNVIPVNEGLLYWSESRVWLCNHTYTFYVGIITHPCPNVNAGLPDLFKRST